MEVTKPVTEKKCTVIQKKQCQPYLKMKCEDVPTEKEVCDDAPEEDCHDQDYVVTKYVDEKVCHEVIESECSYTTREQCDDVSVPVSRKEPKQVCSTKYKEECKNISREVITFTT